MNRRELLRFAAVSGIGLCLPKGIDIFLDSAEAEDKPDLVVARGASPKQITRAAVDAMGGMLKAIELAQSKGNDER